MDVKACIFDLDGVLVDTAKYHYLAWKSLAEELNIPFDRKDNELLKGVSRMTSLDIILKLGGQEKMAAEQKQNLADRKNALYLEYIQAMKKEDSILPGAERFLKELRSRGMKTALGSASKNAPLILEKTDLSQYFDVVIDGNHVSKAKPDPEVFLKGAQGLGIAAENCVVFEDAQAGIEAALAGGMKCVGVGHPDQLKKADLLIEDLSQIEIETLVSL